MKRLIIYSIVSILSGATITYAGEQSPEGHLHRMETGFNAYSMFALFHGYSYTLDFGGNGSLSLKAVIEFPPMLWLSKGSVTALRIKTGAEYSLRFPAVWEAGIGLFQECLFQSQVLGNFQTVGLDGRVYFGAILDSVSFGVFGDIQSSLWTFVQLSEFSLDAFEEQYTGSGASPASGVVTSTAFNITAGVYGYFGVGGNTVLKTELGLKYTPSEYVGFGGGMMFGLLPFHLSVSISYGL
ncbi:MAG: hypothetical protein A2014_12830 [Spirochaetes bacterium GWF1_49_6]|nr:MAG: hypothetical protein A2014_12830 [Spirochaetes bacterium GWF1_49_6]